MENCVIVLINIICIISQWPSMVKEMYSYLLYLKQTIVPSTVRGGEYKLYELYGFSLLELYELVE